MHLSVCLSIFVIALLSIFLTVCVQARLWNKAVKCISQHHFSITVLLKAFLILAAINSCSFLFISLSTVTMLHHAALYNRITNDIQYCVHALLLLNRVITGPLLPNHRLTNDICNWPLANCLHAVEIFWQLLFF